MQLKMKIKHKILFYFYNNVDIFSNNDKIKNTIVIFLIKVLF